MATAMVVFASACSKSEPESQVSGCSFNVHIESELTSKSGNTESNAILADRCVMELFHDGKSDGIHVVSLSSGEAQINVPVVTGLSYDIAFWVDKSGCYETESLKDVRFKEDGYDLADMSMDAFSAVCRNVTVLEPKAHFDVTLKRALAKVIVSAPGDPAKISFTAPSSFNVLDNTLGTNRSFTYYNQSFFVFARETKSEMTVSIGSQTEISIPIQRNHVTNVVFGE